MYFVTIPICSNNKKWPVFKDAVEAKKVSLTSLMSEQSNIQFLQEFVCCRDLKTFQRMVTFASSFPKLVLNIQSQGLFSIPN